ncbi:hypothetical protein T492DRAFT_517409 [Pavlovales sp. CCMP2436]|nr:hypothetical protein T492DRAFT_517409 [Pavlovales sp. CCMP2436]
MECLVSAEYLARFPEDCTREENSSPFLFALQRARALVVPLRHSGAQKIYNLDSRVAADARAALLPAGQVCVCVWVGGMCVCAHCCPRARRVTIYQYVHPLTGLHRTQVLRKHLSQETFEEHTDTVPTTASPPRPFILFYFFTPASTSQMPAARDSSGMPVNCARLPRGACAAATAAAAADAVAVGGGSLTADAVCGTAMVVDADVDSNGCRFDLLPPDASSPRSRQGSTPRVPAHLALAYNSATVLANGVVLLQGALSLDAQNELVALCRTTGVGAAGFATPRPGHGEADGGGRLRLRMFCYGAHWDATTGKYLGGRPGGPHCPPIPDELWALVADSAGIIIVIVITVFRVVVALIDCSYFFSFFFLF